MKNGILSFAGAVLLVPFAAAEAQVAAPDTAAHGVVFSSLERATASQPEAIAGSARLSFTLAGDAFDKTIEVDAGLWRPIDFVPSSVTVESLTFVFPSASASGVPSVAMVGGVAYNRAGSEAVTLAMADGTTLTAYAHTFDLAQGAAPLRVETGTPCAVTFPGNVSSSLYRLEGGNVHVRVSAVADTLTRHVVTIADGGTVAFSALGLEGYEDTQDTVVVVNFAGQGGTLTLDEDVSAAALVLASGVEGAGLAFGAGVALTGPMTLRDGDTAAGGLTLAGDAAGWAPAAFSVGCDLTLGVVLPTDGWFADNTLTIPAGRSLRVRHDRADTVTEANLPNVAFGDAASRLILASDADAAPIPAKYKALIQGQSGTLVLERDVAEAGALALAARGTSTDLTLILAGGHALTVPGDLSLSGYGSVRIVQEGGTFAAETLTLGAASNTFTVAAGATAALATLAVPAVRSTATVEVGGTLTLAEGLAAGSGASGAVNLAVSGTLAFGRDLRMTPSVSRTLRLDGGVLRATAPGLSIVCDDGAAEEEAAGLVVTARGGTVAGGVTVDSVTGGGAADDPEATALTLAEGAAADVLRDFTGVVTADAVRRIDGNSGVVVADLDGAALGAMLDVVADGYRGVFGFTPGTAGAAKTIDFSAVEALTEVPWAFRVAERQHIVIRLDQYADARFRWPDPATGVTLTLIESGAYGGAVTIPHIPQGVAFRFASYDAGQSNAVIVREGGFTLASNEDGVTDTLTWEDPVFTGAGAWIDVEFDGNTSNTGWFTLTGKNPTTDVGDDYNGLLCGLTDAQNPFADKVMHGTAAQRYFTATRHPAASHGGLPLYYRPYVAMKSSLVYPETWSLSIRFTTPGEGARCLVAFGNNDNTGNNPEPDNCNALVLATGTDANEIVLHRFSGKTGTATTAKVLFRARLANATDAAHTLSVVYDGASMAFYLDGAFVQATAEGALDGFRLGRGLQVGAQLGGEDVVPAAFWALATPPSEAEGGVIDFLRFYKGALTDAAMQEIADRTPYVRDDLRYVRDVPATRHEGPETWIQTGAWQAQRWDGTAWVDEGDPADQPAEGAECRLLVAPGEHAIQVNVAVDRDACFYSPNRNYATLVLAPQTAGQAPGTVRLTPLGVAAAETDTAAWEAEVVASAWMTAAATEGEAANNRTGFHYGRLRFTGGAADPITADPAIPDFHGAAYVLSAISSTTETESDESLIAWQDGDDQIARTQTDWWGDSGTAVMTGTSTVTQTVTTTVTVSGQESLTGIYDAGVCLFSGYADVALKAARAFTVTQTITYTNTYTCSGTYSRSRWGGYSYTWENRDDPDFVSSSTPTVTGTETSGGEATGLAPGAIRLVAGMSLTRGERAETVTWRLTGPVRVEGTQTDADDLAHVQGNTDGTPAADAGQASMDVWVPGFGADASWKFYDVTRKEAADNANGRAEGLFAQGVQTPGRLYLDFIATDGPAGYAASRAFSEQAWYRYGYEDTPASQTRSGMAPVPVSEGDYANAVAFQIRLATAQGDVTLALDHLPEAEIDTFLVEDDATDTAEDLPTLALTLAEGANPLPIHGSVIAAARLDISDAPGGMALDLRPDGTPIPVHKGAAGHGALIVGDARVDWDFGAISSVPRLEVAAGRTLTLAGDQDFTVYDRGNTLVAQAGATIAQQGGAATLFGAGLVLGDGATFAFQAEADAANAAEAGVHLAGALTLAGASATLSASADATGGTPHFEALGGIVGAGASTLTVHAAAGTLWHSHTVALDGIAALVKTGAGTADFYANTPPSVTGRVTVSEGTLAVAKAADTPIGAGGLHVARGATLRDNGLFDNTGAFLAVLPEGASLSGGGTVEGGRLRLASGAIVQAAKGQALTATDGFDPENHASGDPDIRVLLPADYAAREPFLVAGRVEPDEAAAVPNVRRRFRSETAEGAVWDTLAEVDPAARTTVYSAQPPTLPAPGYAGPEPNAYGDRFRDAMTDGYRNEGHGLVARAEGYTKAGTEYLLAPAIEGAVTCFGNVMTYQRDATSSSATYFVDGVSLCVAYEFGIAAMREVTRADGSRWLALRVEVRNALADAFPDRGLPADVLTRNAEFREGVAVTFHRNGESAPVEGVERVANLDGTPLTAADATIGRRFYLVPAEALRPGDTLTARATYAPESATP